jgi:hypothetical protein
MASADFEAALESTREIDLSTTGRISGRESSRPVWFVRQGSNVYLLPVTGSDSQWYKNLLENAAVKLAAGESVLSARATPITDPAKVDAVVEQFREKYGSHDVEAYYPKHDVAVEVQTRRV